MPRRPDYKVKAFEKETRRSTEVGVGWVNENGSISIKLGPCVMLVNRPDILITLFPADSKDKNFSDPDEGDPNR